MKNTTVIARNEAISELCRSGNGHSFIRYFLLVLLSCFSFSMTAWSQGRDTAQKDSPVNVNIRDDRSLPNPTKPLIVLDGVPYPGIPNAGDIKQTFLLEGKAATALYGSQAALGVIFVTTKNYKGNWILNNPNKKEDLSIDTDALYVIDGKVSANKLNGINTGDIFDIKILKYDSTEIARINPNRGPHDVVIISTKKDAIKSYQKKFSAFAIKYKEYLENHPNDDNYAYIINGSQINYKTCDGIKKLYDLPVEKIKTVFFLDGSKYPSAIKECVLITTK